MDNENIITVSLGVVIVVLILLIIGFREQIRKLKIVISKTNKEKDQAIEKEKILAEELKQKKIENLRFTLNPHSFRNTLNTIEHLAKSTFDSVNSLSGIFDYMLYDAKNQFVPLEQEILFVQKYIKLYRLKLEPTVDVKIFIDVRSLGSWGENKLVAPLIFAHFIENAFKHGDLMSDEAFIHIKIESTDTNDIEYSVSNKISKIKSQNKGGLGNDTFQERLDLLYENNYDCNYKPKEDVFTANLKLTLYDK